MNNDRLAEIKFKMLLVDSAFDALESMKANPDAPTDISETKIGAIPILKNMGVSIIADGDLVFGFMTLRDDI